MYRSRKVTKQYNPDKSVEQLRSGLKRCPFCHPEDSETVYEAKNMRVIKNAFPYQFWEFMTVTNHLMIVPNRHVESLHEFTEPERAEFINLLADYQEQGYNVYAREHANAAKSVPHQHTHLIKTTTKLASFYFYLRKPYVLLRK